MNMEKFINPPNHYGEVSFFWWAGDDITREKLSWILDKIKNKHICGLQINYCHSNSGGLSHGLTIDSNPPIFSDEWWELVSWFIGECKRYDIAVSLSDYTLATPGQGGFTDRAIAKNPDIYGQEIVFEDGEISFVRVANSINPMKKGLADAIISEFYGLFNKKFPGECGKSINYFFSDELDFNIRGRLWSDDFAEEFLRLKGYDILPKLPALFKDIGDETPKIRLDYYDVVIRLSEEGYFRPLYEWFEKYGMTFGCDHGGRGRDVTEFGDYFRTMKWNQGPGNDQPYLEADIIKTKVNASIAHLYKRPRVWLEGFHSSGWHTTGAMLTDAIFKNFVLGHNLLSLHGLYYSTYGSLWEWAPPCNHHHMPYWDCMESLLLCTKRLSYLLSESLHRCDVAIVYPVAALEADEAVGEEAKQAAFSAAELLYSKGIDIDFIDFESIVNAKITNGRLTISGEEYRHIILPNMQAVRFAMLAKLCEFARCGGSVITLGRVPSESERVGRNDKLLDNIAKEIVDICGLYPDNASVLRRLCDDERDFIADCKSPYVNHRLADDEDIYLLYNIPKGCSCRFRATGVPVLVNPWNGTEKQISDYRQNGGFTTFDFMLEATEIAVIRFVKGGVCDIPVFCEPEVIINCDGEWDFELLPTMDNRYGDFRLPATAAPIAAEARSFNFIIGDNDEGLQQYSFAPYLWLYEGELNDEELRSMTAPDERFSPYVFSKKWGIKGDAGDQGSWHGLKGKLSDDFLALGDRVISFANSSSEYIPHDDKHSYSWMPVKDKAAKRYDSRFVATDKKSGVTTVVSPENITDYTGERRYNVLAFIHSDDCGDAYLLVGKLKPVKIFLNGEYVSAEKVSVKKGINIISCYYASAGRTYIALSKKRDITRREEPYTLWYKNDDVLPFVINPENIGKRAAFSFTAPPGLKNLSITSPLKLSVTVNGEVAEDNGGGGFTVKNHTAYTSQVVVNTVLSEKSCQSDAIAEPILLYCEHGKATMSQTSSELGLTHYSGGIQYKKTVTVEYPNRTTVLNIDEKSEAVRVSVNGCFVANVLAPPYRVDITKFLQKGKNKIEIVRYNSLHEHMLTIPTNYNH